MATRVDPDQSAVSVAAVQLSRDGAFDDIVVAALLGMTRHINHI
ncbi:MAG: hypothetical protein AAFY02_18330 [Pseudomonadota bacterium]